MNKAQRKRALSQTAEDVIVSVGGPPNCAEALIEALTGEWTTVRALALRTRYQVSQVGRIVQELVSAGRVEAQTAIVLINERRRRARVYRVGGASCPSSSARNGGRSTRKNSKNDGG